jgi:hypothetical protein
MIKLIYKYNKLTLSEKKLFFETFFLSFKIRFLIKFYSMKIYVSKLGKDNKLSINIKQEEIEKLLPYINSTKRVSRYSFWRTKCYEEAFTLKKLIEKRGYASTIYFGVLKVENKLKAHAWLKIGDSVLIGGKGYKQYTVTKYFT